MSIDARIDQQYGIGGIIEKVLTGLTAAGKDLDALTVDDLAPIDEFHTRGRESTLEVAELAGLTDGDSVLDVGCGLGGTARHLAETYGCRVAGIDLTDEYITVGQQLTKMVGLHERVVLRQGSALELPFENDSFDVVWTEHVQMNIADKAQFYGEIGRVLRPDGRFAFHDIFRGNGQPPIYPVPWAEDESISALATEDEARTTIQPSGMSIAQWHHKVDESLAFFKRVLDKILEDGPPPIGIHLLMGDNARIKLHNYVQNLTEGRISVAMGLAHKV